MLVIFFHFQNRESRNPTVYVDSEDGPVTELRFDETKDEELFSISEAVSNMAKMRIDDQRCSLGRDEKNDVDFMDLIQSFQVYSFPI